MGESVVDINSVVMPCDDCGGEAAMMIIAPPDTHTQSQFEDYAQMLMWTMPGLKVPTWLVGSERQVSVDGKLVGEALVLRLWPLRDVAQILYSTELNAIFVELMRTHCWPVLRSYH